LKLLGFLLLVAGWIIVLAALALLKPGASEVSFVVVAICVEILGLGLVFRAHSLRGREQR